MLLRFIVFYTQYSGECVHVLESDDSMVTACAFSGDSALLATGMSIESKTLKCCSVELVAKASTNHVHCGRCLSIDLRCVD